MENSKQIQKAGDGSQQVQMINPTIVMGIDEKRVREVCSEISVETIKQYTQEASSTAFDRIEKFTAELIPRIEKIESDFKSFLDPSFQFELRNAQKVAACTDRDGDYELLSELLVHRIEKGNERKTKASISKAIEVVDQIDNDALCGLTLAYTIKQFYPIHGDTMKGLKKYDELLDKIMYSKLSYGYEWLDHLDILGAIRISYLTKKFSIKDDVVNILSGYACIGIDKTSEKYEKATELLKSVNISEDVLIPNALLDGYVRLPVCKESAISSFTLIDNGVSRKVTSDERKVLNAIWAMYEKDDILQKKVNNEFMNKWDSFPALKKARMWWESVPYDFDITQVGSVLARTNAKRCDSNIPD